MEGLVVWIIALLIINRQSLRQSYRQKNTDPLADWKIMYTILYRVHQEIVKRKLIQKTTRKTGINTLTHKEITCSLTDINCGKLNASNANSANLCPTPCIGVNTYFNFVLLFSFLQCGKKIILMLTLQTGLSGNKRYHWKKKKKKTFDFLSYTHVYQCKSMSANSKKYPV